MFRHCSLALVYLVIALCGTSFLNVCQAAAAEDESSSMFAACHCHGSSSDYFYSNDIDSSGRTAMNVCLYHHNPNALLLDLDDIVISLQQEPGTTLLVMEQEPQVSCRENHCNVYIPSVIMENNQGEQEKEPGAPRYDSTVDLNDSRISMSGKAYYVQDIFKNGTMTTQETSFYVTLSPTDNENTCPPYDETPVKDVYVAKGIGLVIFAMVVIIITCCCFGTKLRRHRRAGVATTTTTTSDIPV